MADFYFELHDSAVGKWGAKYHNLLLGKPAYDIFIDDKSFNSEEYFSNYYKKKD